MGREIRRVPANWKHLKNEYGNYVPMIEHFVYTTEEIIEGLHDGWLQDSPPNYGISVMPQWTEEERTHLQMYEDTTEGTPISPVMATAEELAQWLTDNKASACGDMTATYDEWLATIKSGGAPTMVLNQGKLKSGVESIGRPKHHPTFAPSSHDALVKCPFYASDPTGSEATRKGTNQHEYAEALLRNEEAEAKKAGAKIDAGDRDNVEWYVDLVRAQASGDLEIEIAAELQDKNYGVITWGTIDAAAGGEIWDYKSDREERDHKHQMACYALMRIRQKGLKQVTAHICYGKLRKVVSKTYTEEEAWDMVETVLAIMHNPERQQMPNEYCGWCVNKLTCPALTRHVTVVASKYAPEESDKIQMWEPTQMTDPAQVGRALFIARIVGPWCAGVEKHAKLMMENGHEIAGWSILERSGARQVKDITKAFALTGLPEDVFLKCCSVKIGELEEKYATTKGMKKAAAKRELNELLADVIENKPSMKLLVRQKEA